MSYILRHRTFRGKDVYTVCNTGPPTAIVELCNYLLLSSPTDYAPNLTRAQKREGKAISEDEVINIWHLLCAGALVRNDANQFVEAVRRGTKFLFEDCELKPSHAESTKHFFATKRGQMLFSLCNMINVPIHHGWLVDLAQESDFVREAFTVATRNDLHKCAVNEFKNKSVDQLTIYGLASLSDAINEGAFSLLFRRSRLSVICKYHGRLFELITDNNTCNVVNDAMWRTLSVSCEEEVFLASDFSSTRKQPNSKFGGVVEFIKQWKLSEEAIKKANDDQLIALFGAAQDSDTAARKPGKGSKNKKVGDEASPRSNVERTVKSGGEKEIGASFPKTSTSTTSEGVKLSGAGTTEIPPSDLPDDFKWIRSHYRKFLNGYIDVDDDFPEGAIKEFYVRKLKDLSYVPKAVRSLRMVVDYRHVEKYDPELAFAILSDQTRLYDILRDEFVSFCEEHDHRPKQELKRMRLLIDNLPPPESPPESFLPYLKSRQIKLSREQRVFTGTHHTTMVQSSYFGRIAGKGYFDCALEQHNEEKSWEGDFDLEDMAIKNGKFVILKLATVKATKETIYKDFKRITENLFPLYKIAPPYSVYADYIRENHPEGNEYVAYLLEQHGAGNSWDGKWDAIDMAVKDGKPLIAKPATEVADNDSKYNDFKNLILKLFPEYEIAEPAPVYLDILQRQLLDKMNLYDTDPARFRTFLRYLSNNPGWKSPLVLSSLTQNILKVCNSLRKIEADGRRGVPDKLQKTFEDDALWQYKADRIWGFLSVFRFENENNRRYAHATFFCFLEYIRHLDTHLLDFTRDIFGEQLINDIELVFLWIGNVYGEEVAALVFEMMHELSTPPFDSSWRL